MPQPGIEARGQSWVFTLKQSGACRVGGGSTQGVLVATWSFVLRAARGGWTSSQVNFFCSGGSGQVRQVLEPLSGFSQRGFGSFSRGGGSRQTRSLQAFFLLKSVKPWSLPVEDDDEGRAFASFPSASRFLSEIPLAASLRILNILKKMYWDGLPKEGI